MTSEQTAMGTKPKQQLEPTYILTNDFVTNFNAVSLFFISKIIIFAIAA